MSTPVDLNSSAVQNYLSILQNVISRMASNSAACKTWCVALVSAIVVIVADKAKPEYAWVAIVPIALLLFLDVYYLALEKRFRDRYNDFIRKLHSGTAEVDDLFIVSPGTTGEILRTAATHSLRSVSILPFYGLLIFMLLIIDYCVL